MDRPEESGAERQLACFLLGGEKYAVDIMRIKEIIRPLKIKPLPESPRFVEGVVNLRGAVIPVVDLRKRFAIPTPEKRGKGERMIIAAVRGRIVAVVVDLVLEIIRVSENQIAGTPLRFRRRSEFIEGVCKTKDDLITILNLDLIVTTEERIELDQIREKVLETAGVDEKTPDAAGT